MNEKKIKTLIHKQTNINPSDHLWTSVGAFIGIGLIGFIQSHFLTETANVLLIGSFGATAVLLYGATNSPLAQPRNLFGGNIISAFVGVTIMKLLPYPELSWLSSSLAVSISIVLMQITKTLHPPGGATALIATIGNEDILELGYLYVLYPVLLGVFILFIFALIFNNIPKNRKYPIESINFKKILFKKVN